MQTGWNPTVHTRTKGRSMVVTEIKDLDTPTRILLGPGPSTVPPRVLRAMAQPLLGHLDPLFLALMDEVQQLLRYVFRTQNELTIPVSGTAAPVWRPPVQLHRAW
jgi:hypothetical protein